MVDVVSQGVYLESYLEGLQVFLKRDDVTDLYINKPFQVWLETLDGTIKEHIAPSLDELTLQRLAQQVAAFSHQGINRESPLLSAQLPDGARIQIIGPPATRGPLALAIRKYVARDLKLSDYTRTNAFEAIKINKISESEALIKSLQEKRGARDFEGLLRQAVQNRQNILVAGGTSTGKTTFINALIAEIDRKERLIIIEDTPEINLIHENAVGLIATRSTLGEAMITSEDLLNASLRMRPDRIILGELRGNEAFTFLRAVNTGHPGSMTTVHADSPARAIEQIALLILQKGTQLLRDDIINYVVSTIDVYVQLNRQGGARRVCDIRLKGEV
jgi:type IV secretion system protein VirB11